MGFNDVVMKIGDSRASSIFFVFCIDGNIGPRHGNALFAVETRNGFEIVLKVGAGRLRGSRTCLCRLQFKLSRVRARFSPRIHLFATENQAWLRPPYFPLHESNFTIFHYFALDFCSAEIKKWKRCRDIKVPRSNFSHAPGHSIRIRTQLAAQRAAQFQLRIPTSVVKSLSNQGHNSIRTQSDPSE